jgi:hypothetical protein
METLERRPGGSNSITALLLELSEGNREVEARLLLQVYLELRRSATSLQVEIPSEATTVPIDIHGN